MRERLNAAPAWAHIAGFAADCLFPKRCPVCNEIIPFGKGEICEECGDRLTKVKEPYCLKCGKPLITEAEYCSDCIQDRHIYERGRALYVYDDSIRISIYRFKYYGKREYIKYYGKKLELGISS